MATFTGYPATSQVIANEPTNPGIDGTHEVVANRLKIWTAEVWNPGTYADLAPVTAQPVVAQSGGFLHSFGFNDWFNRIHVDYRVLDMGNLLSTQVVEFEVFSTYFENRTLSAVGETGAVGLTLGQPATPPDNYGPWQAKTFTLTISTDGPPTITAQYTFTFDVGTYLLDVIGRRVVSWFVPPNWAGPIVERIEFSTDVIRAYDGTEQRFALRGDAARWFWEFQFVANESTQRFLENVSYAWNSRIWALPLWPQGVALTVDAEPGDVTINCPTTDLDFHVDGLAVLTTLDTPEVYEAIEIESLTASTITAKRGIIRAWGKGPTLVYPVRTARMLGQSTRLSRFTGDTVYGQVGFRCEEPLRRPAATETLYRSFPVQTSKPDWAADPAVDYARKVIEIDFGFSSPLVEDESGLAEPVTSFRWFFTTRAATEAFRKWLFARRGKQKAIWLPSFARDLIVKVDVGASAVNLDVEACGLKNYAAAGVHRRDLRIEMKNGTVYYRRASAYVEVDESTERLTLDTTLGVAYQASDFALVSWMALSRLDQDSVEIAHHTGEAAAAATSFRAPRNNA